MCRDSKAKALLRIRLWRMAVFSFTHRPRSFWLGLGAAAVSLGILAAWAGTWNRNAWRGPFPQYAGVHKGNLMILSSMWRASDTGVRAWRSDGWMYDANINFPPRRWRPDYVRVGNAYLGTPAYKATMHAVSIPLWIVALPPGVLAWAWLRRRENWRGPGACAACGYDRSGTPGRICPECGHAPSPVNNLPH